LEPESPEVGETPAPAESEEKHHASVQLRSGDSGSEFPGICRSKEEKSFKLEVITSDKQTKKLVVNAEGKIKDAK